LPNPAILNFSAAPPGKRFRGFIFKAGSENLENSPGRFSFFSRTV
jgi:hypothetical protein